MAGSRSGSRFDGADDSARDQRAGAVAARCAELMPHYRPMFHPDTFVSQLLGLANEKS